MSKTPFAVGDRVRLIGYSFRGTEVDGLKATVLKFYSDGDLLVQSDILCREFAVKSSQCKKLVKKERRRIWISKQHLKDADEGNDFQVGAYLEPFEVVSQIEFIEVRRKTPREGDGK